MGSGSIEFRAHLASLPECYFRSTRECSHQNTGFYATPTNEEETRKLHVGSLILTTSDSAALGGGPDACPGRAVGGAVNGDQLIEENKA